jgi:hypothetical protein
MKVVYLAEKCRRKHKTNRSSGKSDRVPVEGCCNKYRFS